MAYQAISHARSHRVPFHGLGRAPGYMGNYCQDGMAGPSPGDPDYVAPSGKTASTSGGAKSASSGGGSLVGSAGALPGGGGGSAGGAAEIAGAVEQGLRTLETIYSISSGAPKQQERTSKNNLKIAELQAQAAAGNAQAQVEIARLQAEASVAAARLAGQSGGMDKKTIMILGGVGLLAVLGIGAVVLLKK